MSNGNNSVQNYVKLDSSGAVRPDFVHICDIQHVKLYDCSVNMATTYTQLMRDAITSVIQNYVKNRQASPPTLPESVPDYDGFIGKLVWQSCKQSGQSLCISYCLWVIL
uniref:Uncharacterized protein n=1 Tax=Cacopsylla melanoneura TaxID=428564 RepID=A0A8D8ZFV1_9HEMI